MAISGLWASQPHLWMCEVNFEASEPDLEGALTGLGLVRHFFWNKISTHNMLNLSL